MNDLSKMNDVLFDQLDRLNNKELKGDDLINEANRADAIVKISDKIITGFTLQVKAVQLISDSILTVNELPKALSFPNNK